MKYMLIGVSWVILAACQQAPPPDAPLQKITVAYTYQPQGALIHIAVGKGYFRDEGLDVQSQMHLFGRPALQSVLEQKADIATVAETPIMFNILKGKNIQVLANIVASNTNQAIVARRDAGIAAVADLKGKRIGYVPGTTAEFFLDSVLAANHMVRADVHSIEYKLEEMLDAITTKKIDAVSIWNYPLSQIEAALGANGLVIYDKDIYTEIFNLVAESDFVAKNPQLIERFLRASIKAEEFASAHPEEAQALISAATKVDLALVKKVWPSFQFHIGLDQILLLTLEDETRWAISRKLSDQTQMPNYLSHIYFDGLNAIRPDAIKIKR